MASFLVGAFSLKEKSLNITVGSFLVGAFLVKRARLLQWLVFFFFFRQTTDLIVYVPLYRNYSGHVRPMQTYFKGFPFHFLRNLQNRTRPKGPSFQFFRHCGKISHKMSQKSPPSTFLIFCNRMYVNESQRVPPFHFSVLCDIFEVFFQKNFSKNFKFYFVPSRETVIFQSYRA